MPEAKTTIAHLSDVHLAPLRGLGPAHLNLKRGLGFANWLVKRRKVHLRTVVDAITADLGNQPLDHVIVSGDLVNLGLPGEHAAALEWLEALGPPDRVTVVPGNHDIYCPLWRDPGVQRWKAYMQSDADGARYAGIGAPDFPFVRILGRVALIGLVSAVPTPPFKASGRLGPAQLGALSRLLEALHKDGLFRLVIIHHPPLPGQADARRGLVDADGLEAVLQRNGAELVVHGHNHVDMLASRPWRNTSGATGTVHSVGVASASVGRAHKHEPLGRYNILRIDETPGSTAVEVTTRGLEEVGGPVVGLGAHRLGKPATDTAVVATPAASPANIVDGPGTRSRKSA